MATCSFIREKKQTAGAMGGVLRYVAQEQKTVDTDGTRYLTGVNCMADLAYQSFLATKNLYGKASGTWFYHYVQSFSPDEVITGEQAHQLAKEFAAKAWPDSEVLIATHLDAEHIHSHFVVNAVCWESGKMLRQGPNPLCSLRQLSDELCLEHGFAVLPQQKKKQTQGMGTREYRSAAKGESWEFRLMNTIDQCMRYAETREEFISLMESEGYQVRWTDGRKNITYTTPGGMKCRDDRLHDIKYTKEVMEDEFRIRAEIVRGRTETAEPAAAVSPYAPSASAPAGVEQTAGTAGAPGSQRRRTGGHASGIEPTGGAATHSGAVGDTVAGGGPAAGDSATGWEKERALYLAAQFGYGAVCAGLADLAPAGDYGGHGGLADHLVLLGLSLERGQGADPVIDSPTMHRRSDRKTLRREQEKKIALGHKEDDHEEEQTWQQTM